MMKTRVELIREDVSGQRPSLRGEYSAEIDGNLIRSQANGPFNREMIAAYRKLVVPLFAQAGHQGSFGVLTEFRKSMLASVDALDLLAQTMAMALQETPQFSGIASLAGPDVEGRDMMAHLLDQRVFRPIGVPYRMFENGDEAENWLRSVIIKPA